MTVATPCLYRGRGFECLDQLLDGRRLWSLQVVSLGGVADPNVADPVVLQEGDLGRRRWQNDLSFSVVTVRSEIQGRGCTEVSSRRLSGGCMPRWH
ncbi:hypothetical protein SUGI_0910000 [Cryptomeria japonica]|nr:hypothetical protein SUGI_0910000 [Cryptomeria japonica]